MKKTLFLILIALNAMVLHAYESVADDSEYTSLFAMLADEKVVLLDSIVTHLPDGSLSEKTVYEYNDKGQLARETKSKWQESSWIYSLKKEYRYDKNGNLQSQECWLWEYSYWEKSYKDEWTYDDHGNQTSWDRYSAYRGEYHSPSRTKYENTYDDYGNLTEVIEYCMVYGDWENSIKVENTYNGSNLLTCTVQYSWEDNQWQPQIKHEYTYDANGNQTIDDSFNWYGYWYNGQRFENTYDDNGNLLCRTEAFAGDGWEFLNKAEYTYDAEGNVADETIFHWNFDSKEWVMHSYSVYAYSAHTVILPGTPTVSDTYDFEMDGIEYSILSIEDCTVEVSDTRHVEFDELVIPASFNVKGHELKVIAIGPRAIQPSYIYYNDYYNEGRCFKYIQLPETIETIGRSAFSGQHYLEEIELPESLTSIGNCAFASCSNLKRISLHGGLKSLGDSAFFYCKQLEDITLPDGVETIGKHAFSHTGLHSFTFPASTKYAGSHLFDGCHDLEYVDLERLQAMGELPSALFYDTSVKTVVIPDWVTEIPDYFVGSCKGITEFEFGKSVVRIKESAFNGCNLPASFRLPETLKIIDNFAFSAATAEGSIVIPGNVEEIGCYALYLTCDSLIIEPDDKPLLLSCNCDNHYCVINTNESYCLRLQRSIKVKGATDDIPYSILLNGKVIELGRYYSDSFAQPGSADIVYERPFKLTILEGVEYLGYSYDCEYTNTLLLPSTLRMVSTSDFRGARNLAYIDCRATEPPLCEGKIFADGVYAKAILTVPYGCKEAYQNAEGWKYFWEIVEASEPFASEEIGNGITDVDVDDSEWFSINDGILKAPAMLELYTPDGRLVKRAANGDIADIPHGMYVIKCGSRTAKIAL